MSQGQQWFLLSPRFPSNLLFTSASGELWKMVRIGGQPLGFGETHVPRMQCMEQADLNLARRSPAYTIPSLEPSIVLPHPSAAGCGKGEN